MGLLKLKIDVLLTLLEPKVLGGGILTTTYLINRMPSRVLGYQSPQLCCLNFIRILMNRANYHLKFFCYASSVHIHAYSRGNLDPRALKCVLMHYSTTKKGEKSYHPTTREFSTSLDVTFFDDQPFFQNHNPYLQR